MTVKITSTVRRAYALTEESVGVLVKADLDRAVLTEVVESVVEQMQASDDEVDQLTPVEVQSTLRGPAILLADVDPGDLKPALNRVGELLTDRLAGHGVADVTLTAMPTIGAPYGTARGRMSLVQAWFGLSGGRPDGWRPLRWHGPDWQLTPADLDAAIEELVGWALGLDGERRQIMVCSELDYIPVPADAVLGMVRRVAAQRRVPLCNDVLVRNAAGQMRQVNVYHWSGSMTAAAGTLPGTPDAWPDALDQARTLLAEAGEWAAYGHLTRTVRPGLSAENGQRSVLPQRDQTAQRTLIAEGTLVDAYGVLRLPPAWANRLRLAPTWSQTVLPGGDVLVEHHDLAAWYGAPRIDPDTLTAARTLLTGATIPRDDESLWPVDL